MKQNTFIASPLPLIYVSNGKAEKLSYLDLNRKSEVWGIEFRGVPWKKTAEERCCWPCAKEAADRESSRLNLQVRIPEIGSLRNFSQNDSADFQKTVLLLNSHGIEAESWTEDWYWSGVTLRDECSIDGIAAVIGKTSSGQVSIETISAVLNARLCLKYS